MGVAVALLVLASWKVPANSPAFGAEVSVRAPASGGLSTSTSEAFLVEDDLQPGGPDARGSLVLTNSSDADKIFRMRAVPSIEDLDSSLQVQAAVNGNVIYRGPLGGLRSWTQTSFSMVRGQQAPLDLELALPDGAADYRDRIAEIELEFTS